MLQKFLLREGINSRPSPWHCCEEGTLDGAEIEAIISESVLSPALKARKRWDDMAANAALFTASHGGLKRLAI